MTFNILHCVFIYIYIYIDRSGREINGDFTGKKPEKILSFSTEIEDFFKLHIWKKSTIFGKDKIFE